MSAIPGVIFHVTGGFVSGSYCMAFKKVKNWARESYWLIGGLFSWLGVPPFPTASTIPGNGDTIRPVKFTVFSWTYTMGRRRISFYDTMATGGGSIAEFSLVKGLIAAARSGILSACFTVRSRAGKPMTEVAVTRGYISVFQRHTHCYYHWNINYSCINDVGYGNSLTS